jgi:hypothetical protein
MSRRVGESRPSPMPDGFRRAGPAVIGGLRPQGWVSSSILWVQENASDWIGEVNNAAP